MTTSNSRFTSLPLRILGVIAILLLIWLGRFACDYFDANSPANLAMQVQLRMFGSAMYEYHAMTGRWPTKVEDLSHTSLPAHSYVWRQTANSIVFLWPQNLDPEAQNNRDVALAYWKGGLFNSFGRVWVCWGDLRTEHIKKSQIRSDEPVKSQMEELFPRKFDVIAVEQPFATGRHDAEDSVHAMGASAHPCLLQERQTISTSSTALQLGIQMAERCSALGMI